MTEASVTTMSIDADETSLAIRPAIPRFEGENVSATKAKITSVSALEIGDRVFRLDESLKLLVEVTVDSIQHKVNDKSGFLERIHTLKAIDSVVVDWAVDMDAIRESLPIHD